MILTVRKKPVVVEAVLWTGKNWDEIEAWCPYGISCMSNRKPITIDTLEGKMRCEVGDYIIKGIMGEFYPCKPDVFDKTYEIVTEGR